VPKLSRLLGHTSAISALDVTQPTLRIALAPDATLADALVVELAQAGINTFFGVPGGAIEPLFDALARQQALGRVRLVPMRSEAATAFAADGYYRETGRIAACTATTGPGVSNMLTATMSAHADRVPMLLLTPQVASAKQGRGALQESSMDGYDLPHVFRSCTKYSSVVTHPEQLSHKLACALSHAQQPPGGPVMLSFSSDLLRGPAPAALARPLAARILPGIPVDAAGVSELVVEVLGARAPVFYVGDDAGVDAPRLLELARVLQGSVISSPAGKRWLSHYHPSYRGVVGFSGHTKAQVILESADLLVTFGATFDELSSNAWTLFPAVPTYAVDRHVEFAYRLEHARPVIADVASVARAFEMEMGPAGCSQLEPPVESGRASGLRRRVRLSDASALAPMASSPIECLRPVHPSRLMSWLGQALAEEVVVHVDAGNSFSWSTRDLLRPRPDTYRVAMGLGSMCWAIAAVIGAALGRPRRAVCVTGDGAMLMSSMELTVAVEQRLPITYLILNDSGLGMVKHGQRLSGAEPVAFEIAPVRFDLLGRACGAAGIRVETEADLALLSRDWFESDEGGPCVIDVRIDPEAVPPMGDRVRGLQAGVPK
jgi:acetolactate synthase-1/2/3 large subunit